MKKLCVLFALIALAGCVEIPERNPARLPLHLNTFGAANGGVFPDRPEMTRRFNAYAKECGTGIYQSAGKLAALFAGTLDPANPDYLYYQQAPFLAEYNQCMTLVKDNITAFSVNFRKKLEERRKAALAAMKEKPEGEGAANPQPKKRKRFRNPYFEKSYEELAKAKPADADGAAAVALAFYLAGDYASSRAWVDELAGVMPPEDKTPADVYAARYFFADPRTADTGYRMLEGLASAGSGRAMEILDGKQAVLYRKSHPGTLSRYRDIRDRTRKKTK